MSYLEFAQRILATGVITDPWLAGAPRFREQPVWLDSQRHDALCAAAAGMALVHEELAQMVSAEPELVQSYFGLTPWQCGMWQCSAPQWHGIARADVFWTANGAAVCELNSDTPSGEAEAVLLNELVTAQYPDAWNPNAELPERLLRLIEAAAAAIDRQGPLTVGILYPTEMVEDLSMVKIYRQWLQVRGHRVVLGAPFNLSRAADGRMALLDVACDVLVRHYKTDWWGERLPVRDDELLAHEREPLAEQLLQTLTAHIEGDTAIVNPFGAVLTQNKRAMAFCLEHLQRFSSASQTIIRQHLPFTVRLESMREELWQQRTRWVLKSDYGCEGVEVIIGAEVDQATWEDALAHAITARCIAQEYFVAERDAAGDVVNYGVYLIAGEPAGILARVHRGAFTDYEASMAPVLVGGAMATVGEEQA